MVMCIIIIMNNVNLANPSSVFKQNIYFLGESKICEMAKFSGAENSSGLHGKTFFPECQDNVTRLSR